MMAGATISQLTPDHELILIEKNRILGRKVLISGGGRCNVTTGLTDIKEVLKKYPRGEQFLRTAMYNFPPQKVMEWFETRQAPLKIEKDNRVFPVSNNGSDIVNALENALGNCLILLGTAVDDINKTNSKFELNLSTREKVIVDKLIITTGGQAYRHTGSTGEGYAFAEKLGHSITDLNAGLSSFETLENWSHQIPGISFPKANLRIKGQPKNSFIGPFIFTHKGISGPAVFALSSIIAEQKITKTTPLEILIDLFPSQTQEQFITEVSSLLLTNPHKTIHNSISKHIPKSLTKIILGNLQIPAEKENNTISKKDLNRIITYLKDFPLTLTGRGQGDEFITVGGIPTKEIDPKTMESKICKNLFFAGEIINIDGYTGGYNLQAAWATGRLAGENAGIC